MEITQKHINEERLYQDVSNLIENTQQKVLRKVSQAGVMLYWNIGKRINKEILNSDRATYGKQVITNLGKKLQAQYGKSYSQSTIYRCIQFSRIFDNEKIVYSLDEHLKWIHFVNLLNIDNKLKREFYAEMCRIERWSTRLLNEKIASMLYERTAIAKKPENIIEHEIDKLRENDEIKCMSRDLI